MKKPPIKRRPLEHLKNPFDPLRAAARMMVKNGKSNLENTDAVKFDRGYPHHTKYVFCLPFWPWFQLSVHTRRFVFPNSRWELPTRKIPRRDSVETATYVTDWTTAKAMKNNRKYNSKTERDIASSSRSETRGFEIQTGHIRCTSTFKRPTGGIALRSLKKLTCIYLF